MHEAYSAAAKQLLPKARLIHVAPGLFVYWLVPVVIVYITGWVAFWVFAGFKQVPKAKGIPSARREA